MPPLFQNRITCSALPFPGTACAINRLIGMPSIEALNIFSILRRVNW